MRKEDNQLITHTNAGTPMGELFRHYWLPVLLSEELPGPDCPPLRLPMLGEQLVAFRDSTGRIGIIDAACPHRQASFYYGRCEEDGIRCGYHGWKFDVTGRCLDIPSEPASSRVLEGIRVRAYPTFERGGVIWIYMGPPEFEPPHPELEWTLLPESHVFVSRRIQECNYLQTMEGGLDSSHLSWLHRWTITNDTVAGIGGGATDSRIVDIIGADPNPRYETVPTPAGLLLGARRNAGDGLYYWRITQFIAPCFNLVPPTGREQSLMAQAWVPLDDENCWSWAVNFRRDRPLTDEERGHMRAGGGLHVDFVPGTYMGPAHRGNDYLIDREAQRQRKTFSGVAGIAMQDAAVQESQGPIADRSLEHLVSSDDGIIGARQMLIQAARANQEGRPVPGRDPAGHHCRSASIFDTSERLADVSMDELFPAPRQPTAADAPAS